jgi:hypothetical protein
MKLLQGGLVLLLVVAAYLAGYLPAQNQVAELRNQLRLADQELQDARARMRVAHLEYLLLQAMDSSAQNDFEIARNQAANFFIELRATAARPDMDKYRAELTALAGHNDDVDVALQKKDQAGRDKMRAMLKRLVSISEPARAVELPEALAREPRAIN